MRRRPVWWSWADIIANAERLGIPNFQRGAVWDVGNLTALLESLFEQSPCGSFVLWEPQEDGSQTQHGVPLRRRAFAPGTRPLWLVDGQQRTRAMLDTYEQLLMGQPRDDGWSLVRGEDLGALRSLSETPPTWVLESDEEREDSRDSFWAVVLPAMREFSTHFGIHSESRHVQRGPMFRRLPLRARGQLDSNGVLRGVQPLPLGVIPLASLIAPRSVFLDGTLRSSVQIALQSFQADGSGAEDLDDLIPWGPQFVTGYAHRPPTLDEAWPTPVLWKHLRSGGDATTRELTAALEGLFAPKWTSRFRQFRQMLQGSQFAVGWLPDADVSAAIDAYVRINRAGIRVRAEERALALLSRAHPGLLTDLAHFVSLRDETTPIADHRALLTHEAERQLGFATWMSVVTRYSNLALLGTVGCRWFGTSAIEKDTFGYRLDRVGPQESKAGKATWARQDYASSVEMIEESARRATEAVVFVDSVLSKELCLDHRMARPSTRGLMPLLDLLYRLPESALVQLKGDSGFRGAVARLLRWTLLAPYIDNAGFERLVLRSHDVGREAVYRAGPVPQWGEDEAEWSREVRGAFDRYQETLVEVWDRRYGITARVQGQSITTRGLSSFEALNALALDTFEFDVAEALSLQHRAVGWLYALERRLGAREFSWQAQRAGNRADGRVGIPERSKDWDREEPLRAVAGGPLYPEKQHVVPFSYASKIVDKGGTRVTASLANSVGNLTWLSQRQNGLDALSDRWTVMEAAQDTDNLRARGMLAPSGAGDGRTALDIYEELRATVFDAGWRDSHARAQGLFASFREARAAWMVQQMRQWLTESMPDNVAQWLSS